MADLRALRVAVAGAIATCLALTGCAGVPHFGAVHKVAPAPNVQGGPDIAAQQAPGPAKGASPADIIQGLLVAMSDGDIDAAALFFTHDYSSVWRSHEPSQTVVFSGPASPQQVPKTDDQWSVPLTETGLIDSSGGYSRVGSVVTPIQFTVVADKAGEYRIAKVSHYGSFVRDEDLSRVATPVQVYFPSAGAPPGSVPRLVPDRVFLAPGSQPSQVLTVLLGGPTDWLAPAVRTTIPASATVLQLQTDARTGVTTINLSAGPDPAFENTFKAQLAYTLAAPPFQLGVIALQVRGEPRGGPFSAHGLSPVDVGYDPDGPIKDSPLYYVSKQDALVSVPGTAPRTAVNGLPAQTQQPTTTTVLEHDNQVGRIAVAAGPAGSNATIAGVRQDQAGARLVLSSTRNPAADPWTTVTLPDATSMSTPSFEPNGGAVWTVLTSADKSTHVYRVPLNGVTPGTPTEVVARVDDGTPVAKISALRVSPDGARVALVAAGAARQAYVGVIVPPESSAGTWSIGGVRPIVLVEARTNNDDVFWEGQTLLGVLTTYAIDGKQQSSLAAVASDGYTLGTDGTHVNHLVVDGDYLSATQFAGGPGEPWVASTPTGALTRQPSSVTTDEPIPGDAQQWESLGQGYWPTYAG